MRDILFRGKSNYDKKWHYGTPYFNYEKSAAIIENYMIDVSLETIGQYTGIDDKNGVKVFEGDIVHAIRLDNTEFAGVVDWDEEFACFLILNRKAGLGIEFGMDRNDIEVIGNKFDNPELLEA